jgi:hypothetical protein
MAGVCDKAEGKVQPVLKTFVMGSQAVQNFLLCQPRALCFEHSLSLEEADLKPPLEKPCDSANFLFPTRCEFTRTTSQDVHLSKWSSAYVSSMEQHQRYF